MGFGVLGHFPFTQEPQVEIEGELKLYALCGCWWVISAIRREGTT